MTLPPMLGQRNHVLYDSKWPGGVGQLGYQREHAGCSQNSSAVADDQFNVILPD
jgi:hypothetical protein